jgi:hypothetical protein
MALSDYVEIRQGVQYKMPETAPQAQNTLADVDSQLAEAKKAAANRGRREQILRQIQNLENQNNELKNRRSEIEKNSIADMDEDKVVALAKAKGIKDADIDSWLQARAQRSARSVSEGQKKAMEAQADAMREQNKANDVQAIFDADAEYTRAFEEAKMATDEKAASTDKNVLAKKNKLDTLKSQFNRRYGVTWEDYTNQPEENKKLSVTVTEEGKEKGKGGEVVLQDEEAAVLDETTLQKFNERDTTNKEKRAIKAEAQKKVRQKYEAEQARAKKLDAMRKHLKTLGIGKNTNVMKALLEAQKTTDPMIRRALDEVTAFLRSDKDFKTYVDLKKLLK